MATKSGKDAPNVAKKKKEDDAAKAHVMSKRNLIKEPKGLSTVGFRKVINKEK